MKSILPYYILLFLPWGSVGSIPVFTDFSINNPTQIHYGPIHKLQAWPPINPDVKPDKNDAHPTSRYQFALTPSYFNPSLTNNPKNAVEIFKKLATISTSCILISLPVTSEGDSPIYSLKFRDVLYNPNKEESDKDVIILLDDVVTEIQSTMGLDALNTISWKWVDCNIYPPGPIANTAGSGLGLFSKYAAQQQSMDDPRDTAMKGSSVSSSQMSKIPAASLSGSNNSLDLSAGFDSNSPQSPMESSNAPYPPTASNSSSYPPTASNSSPYPPTASNSSPYPPTASNSSPYPPTASINDGPQPLTASNNGGPQPLTASKNSNPPLTTSKSNGLLSGRYNSNNPQSPIEPNTTAPLSVEFNSNPLQLPGSTNRGSQSYIKPDPGTSRSVDNTPHSPVVSSQNRRYPYLIPSSTPTLSPSNGLSISGISSTDPKLTPNSPAGSPVSPSHSDINSEIDPFSHAGPSISTNGLSKNPKHPRRLSSPNGSTLTLSIPPDFKSVLKTFNGPLKLKLK